MQPVERHPLVPDVSFDGGDLDCGNGLVSFVRQGKQRSFLVCKGALAGRPATAMTRRYD